MINTVVGLLVIAADIYAVLNIVQSNESNGVKALWAALVIVLPVVGLVIWYLAGPKSASG